MLIGVCDGVFNAWHGGEELRKTDQFGVASAMNSLMENDGCPAAIDLALSVEAAA